MTPAAKPAATPVEIAEEPPDLSPVATPAGLFALGRIAKPLAISETVLGWAGLPIGLREILPERTRELERAVAWDAPVEFAFVLATGRARDPVQAFVSVGLASVEAAKQVAKERGYELERLAPGVHAVGGVKGASCAIAPALGAAPARLVCASRRAELEDLLPYATRGMPNERFGAHDFDFELRVEPVRQRFGTALSSARLFAGFLLSRVALDAPRFDGAMSDATYALADEVVALVGDLDVLRAEGTVDKRKNALELDVSLAFRSKKSFAAGLVQDSAGRAGTAPDAFFRFPGDATGAGFSYGVEPKQWDGVRRVLGEMVDAYLEHEKVKGPVRERARKLTDTLFQLGYPVTAFAEGASDTAGPDGEPGSWSLFRSELPAAKLRPVLGDLHAIVSDRALRTALARRLKADEKSLPSSKLGRLTGAGVPAGTQVLTLSVPADLGKQLGDRVGVGSAKSVLPKQDFALAVIGDGTGSLFGFAPTPKELGARLGAVAAGKGPTLADRPELAVFNEIKASGARFTSVAALVSAAGIGSAESRRVLSTLPNHGRLPIVARFDAETTPTLKGRVRFSVPAGAFGDLPGLAPLILDHFGASLAK